MGRNEDDAFLVTLGYISIVFGGLLTYAFWGLESLLIYLQILLVLGLMSLGSIVVYMFTLHWFNHSRIE